MFFVVVCILLTSDHINAIYIKPELLFAGRRYVIERSEGPGNSSAGEGRQDTRETYTSRVTDNVVAAYKRGVLPPHRVQYSSNVISNSHSSLGLTRSTQYHTYGRNMNTARVARDYTSGRSAYNGGNANHFARIPVGHPYDVGTQKRFNQFRDDQANVNRLAYLRALRDSRNIKPFPSPYNGDSKDTLTPRVIVTRYPMRSRYNKQPTYTGHGEQNLYGGHIKDVRRSTNIRFGDHYDNYAIANFQKIRGHRGQRTRMHAARYVNNPDTGNSRHYLQKPFVMSSRYVNPSSQGYSKSGGEFNNGLNGKSCVFSQLHIINI